MGRPASPETELRSVKKQLKDEQALRLKTAAELATVRFQLKRTETEIGALKGEVQEWKNRFDLLLKRTPESLK